MPDPERGDPIADSARARAASMARLGEYEDAKAWALVSIADSLASIARDLKWQRQHGARRG